MLARACVSLWIIAAVVGSVGLRTQKASEAERLQALLDEEWRYWMAQYPEAATAAGVPGHDTRWTDYSPQAIDARARHLRDVAAALEAIDRDRLPSTDRLNYDLYRDLVSTAIDGLALGYDAMPLRGVIPRSLRAPVNQMDGVQQDLLLVIGQMPTASTVDYERIVARLQAAPALVDQTIALMHAGLKSGFTPPRITLRDLPAQVAALIPPDPLKSPLLAPFTEFPASVPAADRQRLTGAAVETYDGQLRPALARLHEFLVKTYVPGARESMAATALPDGEALYAYNVRWHTTTDLTPRQIHEIGLAEVRRIRTAMDRVLQETGFTGSFDEFRTFLRTDPRFYYTDADALLTGYRDIAKRADPQLARLFGLLPRTPYGIRAMADAVAPSQTTAYYEQGALAAGRPGMMHANTYKLDARPKWEMEALTLHEAVPGHHLQISLAQELQGLPEFRTVNSYTAFVEGWALYSESLGTEMGFYRDPYARFGQLTYDMWRAVRLVADTGLHAMGWTREGAIEYFAAHTPKTLQDITVEVDRYIVWPGQALGYKIGQLRILELRAEAERRLGPRFDVRAFHDVLLGQGALPMEALEARVRAWIDGQTGS